jgi:hypothetical protein
METTTPKKKRTNGRAMKAKGDRVEREVAAHMASVLGLDIRRAPLSGGGVIHGFSGGADLSGTPGIHVEVKAVEALSFPAALAQAEASLLKSRAPEVPIVINRRNRQSTGDSYVLLRLDAFLDFYASWLAQRP